MSYLSLAFITLYFLVLLLLAVYGLHRYLMLYLYYKYKHRAGSAKAASLRSPYPVVTVQLPIYNERYVVERLIDAVCAMDYPPDRLEIQVLDDSTDETADITRRCVARRREQGVDIRYLHRPRRTGFKAGALREGMMHARGEFIAIFDADFIPPSDILLRTLPGFSDPQVGMIQTRWGYLNREYSLLTQVQAIMLDGHFVMEHGARSRSGRFFNFNGTAGVWRRSSIDSAGGWQHDTLTEDLDLSYRAQLAGQKFVFLEDAVSPSELPVEMNAFKSQQRRWAKGSIQTARKLLPTILRSRMPFRAKLEAMFHLTNNMAYVLMLMLSLLMFPSIVIRVQAGWMSSFWIDLPFLLAATVSVSLFYLCAEREVDRGVWKRRIFYLPCLMAVGIGICVNNTRAVAEALLGQWTEFERTPKYGIRDKKDRWQWMRYRGPKTFLPVLELLFAFHFGLLVYYTAVNRIYSSIPFLCLFFFGFLYVGLYSVWPAANRSVR
ncbi:MAG: glycosyltransferase family 2 protein [candidate division Zixibacteria bacterium]|nr:glycosyltransferase family 2 protein [candidate division Zixibacteria bacterium]